MERRTRTLLAALVAALAVTAAGAHDRDRALGDTSVVGTTPPNPEGVAVRKHRAYVSTAASFDTANAPPSQITVFDLRSGASRAIAIAGEYLPAPHGMSGEAFDADGKLYVISTQLGILKLDPDGDEPQSVYSPQLPQLPPCSSAPAPCRPTFAGPPPLPNDIAFDENGWLYVTDSFQATIWRIPPGGGPAQIWFQDARLGGAFGPNGLRFDRNGHRLYFIVTADFTGAGTIYTLPAGDHPTGADLATFHQYASEGPDDLVFGRSGRLYVSLAFANAVSVIDQSGNEIARYAGTGGGGIPVDGPANLAFDDETRSLLFANHAPISNNPAHFALLRMYVDDRAQPLEEPELP
jgi:sugar lactone lactonase YvrE